MPCCQEGSTCSPAVSRTWSLEALLSLFPLLAYENGRKGLRERPASVRHRGAQHVPPCADHSLARFRSSLSFFLLNPYSGFTVS